MWLISPCIRQKGEGLIAAFAGPYVIIATYRLGMFPTVCAEAVETLGLRSCSSLIAVVNDVLTARRCSIVSPGEAGGAAVVGWVCMYVLC